MWVQFSTPADFNQWLTAANAMFGFPSPGRNAATDEIMNPGHTPTFENPGGWTITWCEAVDLLDGMVTAPVEDRDELVALLPQLGIPVQMLTEGEFENAFAVAHPPEEV